MTSATAQAMAPPSGSAARPVYWTTSRIAVLLVVAGVLLRLWVVGSGWFLDADHVLRIRAGEEPFGLPYLTGGDIGGSTPGMAAVQWPLSRTWPWDFTPMAAILLTLQTSVLVLVAVLGRQLWGDRRVGLVPLALVALSALGAASGSWWSAALPATLVQLVTASALVATLAWLRGRTVLVLVPAVLVWCAASSFSAVALVAAPLSLLAAPLLDARLRRRMRAWSVALALSVVAFCVGALVLGPYLLPGRGDLGPPDVFAAAVASTTESSVMALVGGPLGWTPAAGATALTEPPLWWWSLVVPSVLVLLVLSSARSRRVALLWGWAGAWVLLAALDVVLRTAGSETAALVARTLRWSGPVLLPLSIVVSVALAAVAAPAQRSAASLLGAEKADRLARACAMVAAGVLVVASVVSLSGFRAIWSQNPSRVFMVGASPSLASSPQDQALLNQLVPPQALPALLAPYNESSRFLATWTTRPPFEDVSPGLRVWTPFGGLVPGVVSGVAAREGPAPACGWLVRGTASIPLETPVFDFAYTSRLTYRSSGDGTMRLRLGDGVAVTVPVRKGFGEVAANIVGGGNRIRLTDLTPGVVLCTDDVAVGIPVVAP